MSQLRTGINLMAVVLAAMCLTGCSGQEGDKDPDKGGQAKLTQGLAADNSGEGEKDPDNGGQPFGDGVSYVCVCFSPDSRYLATADADGDITVWDLNLEKEVFSKHVGSDAGRQFSGPRSKKGPGVSADAPVGGVATIAFSPDGAMLAYGGGSRLAVVDAKAWHDLAELRCGGRDITRIAFHPKDPDTLFVAIGAESYEVPAEVWRYVVSTGEVLFARSLENRTGNTILALAVSQDGKKLMWGNEFGTVVCTDADAGRDLWSIRPDYHGGGPCNVYSIVIFPDGSRFATAGNLGYIRIFDMKTQKELKCIRSDDIDPFNIELALSANGQYLAACGSTGRTRAGYKGFIEIWDTKMWQKLHRLNVKSTRVKTVAFSRNGRWFVAATCEKRYYHSPRPDRLIAWEWQALNKPPIEPKKEKK